MRAAMSCAVVLALSALPTAADARMKDRHGHGISAHRLHDVRGNHFRGNRFRTMQVTPFIATEFFDAGGVPNIEGAAPEPVVLAPPPILPPRHLSGPPSVEHTDVGVTIIRGPYLR